MLHMEWVLIITKKYDLLSFQAKDCYLTLKMTTPLICPLLGIADKSKPDSITTTTPPKHDEDKTVTGGGSHKTLIILLILTCCVGVGAGVFYVIKSPVRRHRVLGFFRRNTGSVLYTRVSVDIISKIYLFYIASKIITGSFLETRLLKLSFKSLV